MQRFVRAAYSRLRPRNMRNRLLALLIVLSMLPLSLLGYFSFHIAKSALVNNHVQANQHYFQTSSEVVSYMFRNVVNMHRLILNNKDIRKQLADSSGGGQPLGVTTINLLQDVTVRHLLDTREVGSLCLFDYQMVSACLMGSYSAAPSGSAGQAGGIVDSVWYSKVEEARGREVFFSYNVLDPADPSMFSSAKLLFDPNRVSGPPIGMLVINMKTTMFHNISQELADSAMLVIAEDELGRQGMQVVFDSRAEEAAAFAAAGEGMEQALQRLIRNDYIVSRYQDSTTGWSFVQLVPAKSIFSQSNQIGIVTAASVILMALIVLSIAYFSTGKLVKPVQQLKRMASEWRKAPQEQPGDEDDIGAIGQAFIRVASEHKELSEELVLARLKEREAELRALQAQIKPHFLYNTLDSMYWMAQMQNNQEIAQLAISLSESFKLSLSSGEEVIPVGQELKHIEHYMAIQNIVYGNRYAYIAEVEPRLLEMKMLKLVLQPLVENAIYHGLEPKVGGGTIWLHGKLEGNKACFTVRDNGVGIPAGTELAYGFGLRNVAERLGLCYGSNGLLHVASEPGAGTVAYVEIMFQNGGEQDESSRTG